VEHHTTLEDIFQEGDQLGGNRVVCYWGCGANVEKGQVYWSHVASEHGKVIKVLNEQQHLAHMRLQ
jgi:hypothetical protein